MAVAGRKPQEDGQVRHRVPPRHDWVEIADVPFKGRPPVSLPSSMRSRITEDGDVVDIPVHKMTRAWWRRIKAMPHCILWSESDWQFALETALVADNLFYGTTGAAAELRHREKILGTTMDARRDLRIRYVDAKPADDIPADMPADGSEGATVTRMDDYRGL